MKKITPFLSFDNQAEQAVKFYKSIFKGTKIKNISRYGDFMPGRAGQVMTIEFTLLGQDFVALNGGPAGFNQAISFAVKCKTQKEVDTYWKKLTADGGKEVACGWLTDKYGLSWQIVPEVMLKYMTSKNQNKKRAAMEAMMKMVKLDAATLKKAYDSAK